MMSWLLSCFQWFVSIVWRRLHQTHLSIVWQKCRRSYSAFVCLCLCVSLFCVAKTVFANNNFYNENLMIIIDKMKMKTSDCCSLNCFTVIIIELLPCISAHRTHTHTQYVRNIQAHAYTIVNFSKHVITDDFPSEFIFLNRTQHFLLRAN